MRQNAFFVMLSLILNFFSLELRAEYNYSECGQKFDNINWKTDGTEIGSNFMRRDFYAVGKDVNLLFNDNLPLYKSHLDSSLGSKKFWADIGLCVGQQLWENAKGSTGIEMLSGLTTFAIYATADAYTFGNGSQILRHFLEQDSNTGPTEFDLLFQKISTHIDSRISQERVVDLQEFYRYLRDKMRYFRSLDQPAIDCLDYNSCTTYHLIIGDLITDLLYGLNSVIFGGEGFKDYFQSTIYNETEFLKKRWQYSFIFIYLLNELHFVVQIAKEVSYLDSDFKVMTSDYLEKLSDLIRSYYSYRDNEYINSEEYLNSIKNGTRVSYYEKVQKEIKNDLVNVFGASYDELNNMLLYWSGDLGLNISDYRLCNLEVDRRYLLSTFSCPHYDYYVSNSHAIGKGAKFVLLNLFKNLGSYHEFSNLSTSEIGSAFDLANWRDIYQYDEFENDIYVWLNDNFNISSRSDYNVFRDNIKKMVDESNDFSAIRRKIYRYELTRITGELDYKFSNSQFFEWLDRIENFMNLTEEQQLSQTPILLQIKNEIKKQREQAAILVILNYLI